MKWFKTILKLFNKIFKSHNFKFHKMLKKINKKIQIKFYKIFNKIIYKIKMKIKLKDKVQNLKQQIISFNKEEEQSNKNIVKF